MYMRKVVVVCFVLCVSFSTSVLADTLERTAGAEQPPSPESFNPYLADSEYAKQVLNNNSQWLSSIPGVDSLGLSIDDNNQVVITVNVSDAKTVSSVQMLIPSEIDGVPLVVQPPQSGTGV
jgi:hypothetical protein